MRRAALLLPLALAAGACGGGGKTVTDPAQARLGHAAGEALVCVFSQAKYPTAAILAQDFHMWVAAGLPRDASNGFPEGCPAPPSRPLSPTARTAAAGVVVQYVKANTDRFGANWVAYLKANGVR